MQSSDEFLAGTWDDYIGQDELKRTLDIHIRASVAAGRRMPHTLLAASPGYGKTALANIIADESDSELATFIMGKSFKMTTIISLMRSWLGGTLFLDEIHRASQSQQEDLLSLLQDGYMQTRSGEIVPCQHVTVIAATTEPDKLIAPLYDRFELKPVFKPYSAIEMAKIVQGMGSKVEIDFSEETAIKLGRAAAGTPRVARSLVIAARSLGDTAETVTVDDILRLAGVDPDGMNEHHIAYMNALAKLGGIAGQEKLLNMLRIAKPTLMEIERLLVERGYIAFGRDGRELLGAGFRKIRPEQQQTKEAAKPVHRKLSM